MHFAIAIIDSIHAFSCIGFLWSSCVILPLVPREREREARAYLSGTHGGLEGGETMIEGTKNGDHVIGDGLASVKRVFNERRSFSESSHGFRYSHCDWNFLSLFRIYLVAWKMKNAQGVMIWSRNWWFFFPFWFLLQNEPVAVSILFPRPSWQSVRESVEATGGCGPHRPLLAPTGSVGPHLVRMLLSSTFFYSRKWSFTAPI